MRRARFTCLFILVHAATASAAEGTLPRMPWGDPDLQGIWSNATVTTLTRPDEADKLTLTDCLLYTSPSPRDRTRSRMPSSA